MCTHRTYRHVERYGLPHSGRCLAQVNTDRAQEVNWHVSSYQSTLCSVIRDESATLSNHQGIACLVSCNIFLTMGEGNALDSLLLTIVEEK